jgi:hypothetical protein
MIFQLQKSHMTSDGDDPKSKFIHFDETNNFHVERFLIQGHIEGVSTHFLTAESGKAQNFGWTMPALSGHFPGTDRQSSHLQILLLQCTVLAAKAAYDLG